MHVENYTEGSDIYDLIEMVADAYDELFLEDYALNAPHEQNIFEDYPLDEMHIIACSELDNEKFVDGRDWQDEIIQKLNAIPASVIATQNQQKRPHNEITSLTQQIRKRHNP